MSNKLIDAHIHLGSWRFPKFNGVSTDVETLTRELRSVGIGGVAMTTSDQADNAALVNATLSCPLDVWAFAWVRPDDPSLVSFVEEHSEIIRGLKIHASIEQVPLDDPRWDPAFDLAARRGLRVMLHTGRWQPMAGYTLALDRAARWPGVSLILSHAGGDTPELCLGAAAEVARRGLDNVSFDTAGLREHWALEQAMRLAGPERYMMGSDFPLAHPAMYVAQLSALRVPESWKAGLLGQNALRVLGQPSRRARAAVAPRPRTQVVPAVETEHTVLVTGAGGPIGVNLTRSLRLCSRPLRLVGTDANRYHRPLALTDVCLPVPRADDQGYLARLNAIIAEYQVDVVIPTHPVEVRALSVLRDRVQVRAPLFLPPHQAILNGQDKMRSHELFSAAGVPVPRTLLISEPADVTRAFEQLGPPPVWFRGSGVPGAGIGVASLPCQSEGVARAWVEHHQGYGQMMASEFLPGDNLTWLGVWHQGVLWASQSRQRLEYVIPHVSPSGVTGAPAVAHTVSRADVRQAGEAAVRAICPGPPHGIFFVDLKADTAGVARVTEVNAGRFGTTLHFYTAAGFNFPELALNLALGRLPEAPAHDPLPADTYWIRTLDCGPVLLPGSALDTE